MSRKRFLYLCLVLAILFSGAVMPLFQPAVVFAAPPNTPTNNLPSDNATGVSLMPTLQSSAFSDPGDTHFASQWQITITSDNYSTTVFNSVEYLANLTSIGIPASTLDYSILYYWHVRHQDNNLDWSEWSRETSFTTLPNQPPNQPTNSLPANLATDQSLTPTLQSSDFDDPGDTHAASQWQIRLDTGDYSTPVYDSGPSTASTGIVVPSGELTYSTTYYWHVSYQDSYLGWSAWSLETSFTTSANQPPNQPTNSLPANLATDQTLTPTLQSSVYSDPEGDAHAASQWQISTSPGDYTSPAFNSVTYSPNLTSTTVPVATLGYTTTYYWHVRHQDNNLEWSAWSAETSFTTGSAPNLPPNTPSNSSPASGATDVILTPTLESSAFSDPDTLDTHAASDWQITTMLGNYTGQLVYESLGDTSNLTSLVVPSATLSYSTLYYWHVRHQDNNLEWSAWSAETSFTTGSAPNLPPNTPSNDSPANGAPDVILTPTLTSSGFTDPDAGDTHAASQWQIRTSSGDYSSPLYDSGTDVSNLTSIVVPSGELDYSTIYYWHVRYQDNNLEWSAWSAETSFTTGSAPNLPPNTPSNDSPANGAPDQSLTPTLTSSGFTDPDAGDTHVASRWQIRTSSGSYSAPVLDRVEVVGILTEYTLTQLDALSYSTTYYWHVSYQDNHGTWSENSTEWSFTTAAPPSQLPNQPSNVSPTNGETVSLTPTLESSAFSDPDAADTHAASQWQITTTAGNYSSPVYDSITYYPDLTSKVVPSDELDYSTTYYWHVRYQDNQETWSEWSVETSFTTPPGPKADFSADVTVLTIGQSVEFTDASAGEIKQWRWDFGDGSTSITWSSKPQSGKISHIYTAAGTYTVSLKVTDSKGKSDTEAKTGYITVYTLPQAGFSASAISVLPGGTITFTSSSTGGIPPLTYAWDFNNDGIVDSTNQKPTYSYAVAGTYTVSLKIIDLAGNSDTETRTGYIIVGNAIAPHAVPPQGGTIQTADGQITTTFPADAFNGDATVTILQMSPSAAPKAPKGYRIGSSCFTLEAVSTSGKAITSFSRPVTITVRYSDGDMAQAGDAPKNLVLAYYTEATGKWSLFKTIPNGTNKSLSATTTHFSTWAILVKTHSDGLALWIRIVIGIAAALVVGVVVVRAVIVERMNKVP
jgi:PKD repeat protein